MRVVDRPSPNHGPRRGGADADILLLHYTDMARTADALDRLCDPAAQVSAHYVVGEDGTVWRLVPESQRAWHAGVSWWAGEADVNSRSIGIEIANPGHSHGYRPFPEPQMTAVVELCREILSRHPIPPHRVLGHSDVSPGRKIDPGHLFDWAHLARAGVGLWPEAPAAASLSQAETVAALAAIGYRTESDAPDHPANRAALSSFCRHWCPEALRHPGSRRMAAMLQAVAGAIKKTRKSHCAPGG
jgi:N-acetylmuramoyl-L-alanine amidase